MWRASSSKYQSIATCRGERFPSADGNRSWSGFHRKVLRWKPLPKWSDFHRIALRWKPLPKCAPHDVPLTGRHQPYHTHGVFNLINAQSRTNNPRQYASALKSANCVAINTVSELRWKPLHFGSGFHRLSSRWKPLPADGNRSITRERFSSGRWKPLCSAGGTGSPERMYAWRVQQTSDLPQWCTNESAVEALMT